MKLAIAAAIIVLAILPTFAATALFGAQPREDSCATCHLALGVDALTKPAELYKSDIHASKDFGCVDCHGGDASIMGLESMDRKKGFIGKPAGAQIVEVCGKCHSNGTFMRQYNPSLRIDQVAEYYTSVHGIRLKEHKDPKVATCASCHQAHSIRPASDPRSSIHPLHVADTCGACHANKEYMASYEIPIDQVEKYKKSVHWQMMSSKGDLSAPTCNDCHGNHGAAPPGVSSVVNVCGQCHVVNSELFNKSIHSKIFAQMTIPGCSGCHNNHETHQTSDAMLGRDNKSACATCHTPTSSGAILSASMLVSIDRLREGFEKAHILLDNAEHAGMEVSQPLFELNEAKTALVKARAAIHSFDLPTLNKAVEPGLKVVEISQERGVKALEELQFRRKGLAVSAVVIFALVVAVILKIRQMERGPK